VPDWAPHSRRTGARRHRSRLLLLRLCKELGKGLASRWTCQPPTWCPHDLTAIGDENPQRGSGLVIAKITRLHVFPAVVRNHPSPADSVCVRDYEVVSTQFSTCQLTGFNFVHDTNIMSLELSPPTRRNGAGRSSACSLVDLVP